MKQLIMCSVGEMALKGLNKSTFEAQLMKAIRIRCEKFGEFKIYKAQSTFYIEPENDEADVESAYEKMKKVFGIATLTKAAVTDKNFDNIAQTVFDYLGDDLSNAKTFKVTAKRADKSFPMTSPEISAEIGHVILEKYPSLTVDMHNPQVTVMIEVRDFGSYVHKAKENGAGGMPVSSSGKGALMMSGGIDSPVAAYMMAKRGMTIMPVHFASPPYTGERARQKVITLCEKLSDYTGNMALHIVPFTAPQEYIRDNGVPELFTILMRRSMMRITEMIAHKNGAQAIITGESLGQVASQTINALAITNASVDMPIFRPAIGMDKTEIVEVARKIDTFETSILPYEDCCTIFTPAHPRTKPKMYEILKAEEKMNMEVLGELERKAADEADIIRITL